MPIGMQLVAWPFDVPYPGVALPGAWVQAPGKAPDAATIHFRATVNYFF
jgi:hypothetical protein